MCSVEGFGGQVGMAEYESKKQKMGFFAAGLVRAFNTLIFSVYPQYVVMLYRRISQRPGVQGSIFQMEKSTWSEA